jgi:hypothetical protein
MANETLLRYHFYLEDIKVGRSRTYRSRLVGALGRSVLILAISPSIAGASCAEAWPVDMKTRPDFTCVPFTDELLVSLEGSTESELIKTMKAIGRPLPRKTYTLHFVSVADRPNSGDMNFEIEGNRVVRIFGVTDAGEFLWNSGYHGPGAIPCSDLADSRYTRCNVER